VDHLQANVPKSTWPLMKVTNLLKFDCAVKHFKAIAITMKNNTFFLDRYFQSTECNYPISQWK